MVQQSYKNLIYCQGSHLKSSTSALMRNIDQKFLEPLAHKVMKVRVLELFQVAPPLGSVTKPSHLSLTFFDLPLLIMCPSELLFFYDLPNIEITHFMDYLIPQIKHSLSLTLQHFYPLAGNLTWPQQSDQPFINYVDGDSVTLTVAESNADFNQLSGYQARDPKDLQPLVPQLMQYSNSINKQSDSAVPVLALQITLFPNSGICLGITQIHAALDGRSTALFLSSWASVSQLGRNTSDQLFHDDPSRNPFYDRTVIKDTHGFQKLYLQGLVQFIRSKYSMSEHDCTNWLFVSMNHLTISPKNTNHVTATFQLTGSDITRLKQYYHHYWVSRKIHPSRFELICAYVWVCLAKSSCRDQETTSSSGDDEAMSTSIMFLADYRSRLDPPVPTTYFGNCIMSVKVSAKRNDIVGEDGIVVAVDSIKKVIRGLGDGLVRSSEARLSHLLSNNGPNRVDVIAGSPQFKFYKVDFGWGRPKKVELVSITKTGGIFLSDSRNGTDNGDSGGVEISLFRGKDEIDAFGLSFVRGLNDLINVSSKKGIVRSTL